MAAPGREMAAAGPGGGGNLGTQSQGAGLDDDDLDIPGAGDFIDDAAPQDGDQLLALGPEGLAPDEEAEARAALAVVAAAPKIPGPPPGLLAGGFKKTGLLSADQLRKKGYGRALKLCQALVKGFPKVDADTGTLQGCTEGELRDWLASHHGQPVFTTPAPEARASKHRGGAHGWGDEARRLKALQEFYAVDVRIQVFDPELLHRDELRGCAAAQVTNGAGKVTGVRLPCAHCGSNEFTFRAGYTTKTRLKLVQGEVDVWAAAAVNMCCSSPDCPAVQQNLRDFENGTGKCLFCLQARSMRRMCGSCWQHLWSCKPPSTHCHWPCHRSGPTAARLQHWRHRLPRRQVVTTGRSCGKACSWAH